MKIAAVTSDTNQDYKSKENDLSSDVEKLQKYRSLESKKSIFFNRSNKENVQGFYLCQLIWGECKDKNDFEVQKNKVKDIIKQKTHFTMHDNHSYSMKPLVDELIFPKDNVDRGSFEMNSWNWILLVEVAPFTENLESEKDEYWFQYSPSEFDGTTSTTQIKDSTM